MSHLAERHALEHLGGGLADHDESPGPSSDGREWGSPHMSGGIRTCMLHITKTNSTGGGTCPTTSRPAARMALQEEVKILLSPKPPS
ncbi:hypothetical protein PG987_014027 [Apiospora arundinis]